MKMECNPPLWQSRRRAPSFVFYLRYAHRKISFLSANRAGLMFLAKNSQPHYFLNSCRHWNEWVCFHHQLTHSVNGTSIYLILKGPLSLSFFALCQSKRFWKLLAFIRAHRPNFGGCGGWKSDKAFSLEYLQRRKESEERCFLLYFLGESTSLRKPINFWAVIMRLKKAMEVTDILTCVNIISSPT